MFHQPRKCREDGDLSPLYSWVTRRQRSVALRGCENNRWGDRLTVIAFGSRMLRTPCQMFICGNDTGAKATVTRILDQFGWETEDIGQVEAARAIEPLCMLWAIRHHLRKKWDHASSC
jgi:hypothetical protein